MKRSTAGITALALAGALALGGCGSVGQTTQQGASVECQSSPNNSTVGMNNPSGLVVVVTPTNPGGLILAVIWAWCSTTPTEHHLTVELQEYKGTSYPGADKDGYATIASRDSDNIPVGGGMAQPYTTSIGCEDGLYRVYWSVVGTSSDGVPFTVSDTTQATQVSDYDCVHEMNVNDEPDGEDGYDNGTW